MLISLRVYHIKVYFYFLFTLIYLYSYLFITLIFLNLAVPLKLRTRDLSSLAVKGQSPNHWSTSPYFSLLRRKPVDLNSHWKYTAVLTSSGKW